MEAFKHRDPEAAWVASTNHVSEAEAVALRILKRIKEEHNQSQIKRFSTNLLGGEALEGIE
jgi:hypothetical protein